jgi:hypothetical protein
MRGTSFGAGLILVLACVTPLAAQDTASHPVAPVGQPKSVMTARLLGIAPGAGHIYAGEVNRAVAFGMATYTAFALNAIGHDRSDRLCTSPPPGDPPAGGGVCTPAKRTSTIVVVAVAGLIGWSSYDAGRAATRWNARHGHQVSALIEPAVVPGRGREERLVARVGVRIALR